MALAALIVWWGMIQGLKPRSYEFSGNVETVGDSTITVRGQFVDAKTQRLFPGELVLVEVEVSLETRIVREAFRIPSAEELTKTGGIFKPDELPREQSITDLLVLKQDTMRTTAGAVVKASKNVFGKSRFEAEEIAYRVPIFPAQPILPTQP